MKHIITLCIVFGLAGCFDASDARDAGKEWFGITYCKKNPEGTYHEGRNAWECEFILEHQSGF